LALIFSRAAKQWGSFAYRPDQDALRIQARPRACPPREYLAYTVQVAGPGALRVELAWDTLAVGFDVALDAQGIYWAYLEKTLAGARPDEYIPFLQGARY